MTADAARALGVAFALVSAYWGIGGTWLLNTVGGSLARAGRNHDAGLLVIVWVSVVLKLCAAARGPLALIAWLPARRRQFVRVLAWTAAVILTAYGGLLTAVGLVVQADIVHAGPDADAMALRWHAYLWDPWFLVWGVLPVVTLLFSRPRRVRSG